MKTESIASQRDAVFDWIRVIACFMVIMIHVSALKWYELQPSDTRWQMMEVIDTIVQGAVPLFFMVSGALFLRRATLDIKRIWLHNILHLMVVYIVWSIFYAFDTIGVTHILSAGIRPFLKTVIDAKYHMWFIPAIIGVYILSPALHAIAHADHGRTMKYYLLIFFLFRILRSTLLQFTPLPSKLGVIVNLVPVELLDYCGYFILGYWLTTVNTKRLGRWVPIGIFTAVSGISAVINIRTALGQNAVGGILHGNFTLPTFIQAITIFILCQNSILNQSSGKIIGTISKCTLGIYLFHDFVYMHLYTDFGVSTLSFCPLISIIFISLITFLLSAAVILGIRQIPIVSKWIT